MPDNDVPTTLSGGEPVIYHDDMLGPAAHRVAAALGQCAGVSCERWDLTEPPEITEAKARLS